MSNGKDVRRSRMDNLLTNSTAHAMPLTVRSELRDDLDWLDAARSGETWALERLFDTYRRQIYTLCVRLLNRTEDAEDAVQATFVKAFRALPAFRGKSSVKTWLYRIATNECISALRGRRDLTEVPESAATADNSRHVLEQAAVQAALVKIPPKYRAALVLRYWEDLECDEMADVLGISRSAAKMRLHRARSEFRRFYEGDL